MVSDKQSEDKHQDSSEGEDVDLTDMSHLIADNSTQNEDPVNEIKVRPQAQQRISLGSFTGTNAPKGFSVGFVPDPDPDGSVVTEMISLGTAERYELILHIANYGNKEVDVKVWQV